MVDGTVKALKLAFLTCAFYLLAGLGVVATLYLASHLFLLTGQEVKWLLRLLGV